MMRTSQPLAAALARALLHRMVFGEAGRPHAHRTQHLHRGRGRLRLADHVFIGQFNFIDATHGLVVEGASRSPISAPS